MNTDKRKLEYKVRQANNLIESPYAQEFTPHEIKIFEVATAEVILRDIERVNSYSNKRYSFTASQLAVLLNTSLSVISHEIEKTAARIMKKTIHLRKVLSDGSIEFEMINIIPYAKYQNGVLEFDLNYAIIPYLVELNKNFTEYYLHFVLKLSSAYAIKIYKLLYQYKNIKSRVFRLDELKIQCGLEYKYAAYKDFKKWIIEPSIKQINELTDLCVEYSELKLGRKVDKLEFKFYVNKEELIKNKASNITETANKDFFQIETLLGNKSNDVSDKTKSILNKLIPKKGLVFVECSIEYAKKNATTNFEKYLLDAIKNNWAEVDIQKLESKRQAEEIDKQKRQAALDVKNKELELENANKSEIEHLFLKLTDSELNKYSTLATNILNKNAAKLKHSTVESLSYSIFAVTNGRYYDKKTEIFISKFLNTSLNINDYIVS